MGDSKAKEAGIVVISGPSGVGKSTICAELIKRLDNFYLSVSATTRAMSQNEIDGQDYWFISKEEFDAMASKGLLLEYAEVFGNWYGTPKDKIDEALAAGKSVILEIDVQGAKQVKRIYPEAKMIFIMPPKKETLAARMQYRARDDGASAPRRLNHADNEIAAAQKFFEYSVINDDLGQAVNEVIEIID